MIPLSSSPDLLIRQAGRAIYTAISGKWRNLGTGYRKGMPSQAMSPNGGTFRGAENGGTSCGVPPYAGFLTHAQNVHILYTMRVKWDQDKQRTNLAKHGIEFADAIAVLSDPQAVMNETYDFSAGKRGPVAPPDPGKTRITIRLDNDVIDWFRQQVNDAGGGNYQTLINATLRDQIQRSRGATLEDTLRKVIREELRAAS